jgi:hypothetical protein
VSEENKYKTQSISSRPMPRKINIGVESCYLGYISTIKQDIDAICLKKWWCHHGIHRGAGGISTASGCTK